MDPLTHTLAGAAIARTPLARTTRLGGVALVVGANLPDVDVASFFAGADAALGFRRGWTHGPLALVALPVLLAAALVAWDAGVRRRRPAVPAARPARVLGLAFLGCLSHPLLDWLNTYGVRFLMPFDERWFYGDAVFIIDPWLWLLLGGAAFLGSERRGWLGAFPTGWLLLAALTTAPVLLARDRLPAAVPALWLCGLAGIALLRLARRRAAPWTGAAATGLGLAVLYVALMIVNGSAAAARVRAALEGQGVAGVGRLMVGPAPADPFRWDVVAETPAAYRHGSFDWLPRPRLELHPDPIPRPRPSPVVDAALAAPQVRGAMRWMRFPFVEVREVPAGYEVRLLDARYVRSRRTGFGTALVRLDRSLRVRRD